MMYIYIYNEYIVIYIYTLRMANFFWYTHANPPLKWRTPMCQWN